MKSIQVSRNSNSSFMRCYIARAMCDNFEIIIIIIIYWFIFY